MTRRANQRYSFIIAQSVRRPWSRNGALFGVILGENPYPRLKLHWLLKLQWPAAAAIACVLPSGRASDARTGGTVGSAAASHAIMDGHPAEHAQQDARLRTMALGTLILNAFSVRAAPGRFIRCRCSAIQNNVQTNTYDPRRPQATPSLLSCRRAVARSPHSLTSMVAIRGEADILRTWPNRRE